MQILDIILYGESGKQRILSFDIGKVNIITGDSRTGKTAIIDIVDYCLGSDDFKVPDGVVRECIWWYAVRYQLKQGQILVARPNPTKYLRSASDVYFLQGDTVIIPDFSDLKANINVDMLLQKLANVIGIDEYVDKADHYIYDDLTISFKHSRFYCFQPQTDIDQRDFLFYNQKKNTWIEVAMKRTLPYFLGAVGTENMKMERELADKIKNVNRLERELKDSQAIVVKARKQVFELINEAKQVGLLSTSQFVKDEKEALEMLQIISTQDSLQETPNAENEVILSLQSQREIVNKELDKIKQIIKETEKYQKETQGYESEAGYQTSRLESVNIYPTNKEINNSICPLCNQGLTNKIPVIEQIKQTLLGLQNNLKVTFNDKPRLKQYLDDLDEQRAKLVVQTQDIEKNINAIYKENKQAQNIKDLNVRKGRVLGRISLYLESKEEVSNTSETNKKLFSLKNDIETLRNKFSKENDEDKLQSILDQLSVQMTSWSKELKLEFENSIIRFNIKKLTLFINSAERTIPFDQTGSGETWIAYHLLIHFALHKYFILHQRPTPNFLILDQMSQAYFPPEKDLKGTGEIEQSEDDMAIKRFFDFVFKRTEELKGKMQTIIIDHAKLNDEKFTNAIKEEWRKGTKLVPIEWISADK